MKLISAGSALEPQPYTNLLFNCIRNPKCQRPFYVPVNDFSDIVFYTDLPGSPTVTLIEVLNVCDIDNVGTAVSTTYVAGTKPDLSWYGVFGGLVVTPPVGVTYNRFFFRFTFTVDGNDYVYYSEQFEFPYCEDLMTLKGCYPNEVAGVDAIDCNGIYYGVPTNAEFLGDQYYRYFHWAFLRMASVIEQRNKMTFTAFNNKRIYKTLFNREWLLEHELVPGFFKDVLIGIYNRGNIRINGTEWKLAESQDISIVDIDSKLWKLDMILDSECKQVFGCKPADCEFPVPPPPCDPVGFDPEVDPPELPDAFVNVPYNYSFDIVGTAPFVLIVTAKPSWMTIALVGNTVTFSGTPDTEGVETVNITITNCDDLNSINLDQEITITEVSGQMIVTSTDATLSIVGIVNVIISDIIYPVTATVDFGTYYNFLGGNIQVNLSVTSAGFARLLKNGVQIDIQAFTALQGFVTFTGVAAFADGDIMEINVQLT